MNIARVTHRGWTAISRRARMNGSQRTAMRVSHTPVAVYARTIRQR